MISANVIKSAGHALIVGGEACRPQPRQVLQAIGYETDERDDPYAALLELCARPLVYRATVLSLQSLYRDELSFITTVRQRFPHVSVWLAHTDGRQAALVEAMRLGAEAIVSVNGVHSLGDTADQPQPARPLGFRPVPADESSVEAPSQNGSQNGSHGSLHAGLNGGATNGRHDAGDHGPHGPPDGSAAEPDEPVLTADELHALLGGRN